MSNWQEDLVADYYQHEGFFVRKNIYIYNGEVDIIGLKASDAVCVEVGTESKREITKKFDPSRMKHVAKILSDAGWGGNEDQIKKIYVYFPQGRNIARRHHEDVRNSLRAMDIEYWLFGEFALQMYQEIEQKSRKIKKKSAAAEFQILNAFHKIWETAVQRLPTLLTD